MPPGPHLYGLEAMPKACFLTGMSLPPRRQLNGMFAAAKVAAELSGESVQTLGQEVIPGT
jgi:hypothetical protein